MRRICLLIATLLAVSTPAAAQDTYARRVPTRLLTRSAAGTGAADQNMAALVNGAVLCTNTSGGVATLEPCEVVLRPAGGGTDDMPRLTALFAAGYRRVRFSPGAYTIASAMGALTNGTYGIATAGTSQLGIPSDTRIILEHGVTINGAFTDTSSQKNSIFWTDRLAAAVGTTTNAEATPGSSTIHVTDAATAGITAGKIVMLSRPAYSQGRAQTYRVLSVTTEVAPAAAVVLDRPVRTTWPSATVVTVLLRRPERIVIEGPGIITGVMARAVELIACYRCEVRDITIAPTTVGDGYVASFDIGGTENAYRHVRLDFPSNTTATNGLGVESGEATVFEDTSVVMPGATASGYKVIDSVDTSLRNIAGTVIGGNGVSIAGAPGLGSSGTTISKADLSYVAYGVVEDANSTNSVFDRVVVRNLTARGFFLAGTGAIITHCRTSGSGGSTYGYFLSGANASVSDSVAVGAGLAYYTGADGIVYTRDVATDSTSADFGGTNGWKAVDCVTSGCVNHSIHGEQLANGSFVEIVRGNYGVAYAATPRIVQLAGSGQTATSTRFLFDGVTFTFNGTSSYALGIVSDANIKSVTLKSCRFVTVGSNTATYGIYPGTSVFAIYEQGNNDFTACATPRTAGSAQWNRGTLTLNGATPVDVTFGDIKAGDVLVVDRNTAAGTPGQYACAIGTGKFTCTGTALDTSVLRYVINP